MYYITRILLSNDSKSMAVSKRKRTNQLRRITSLSYIFSHPHLHIPFPIQARCFQEHAQESKPDRLRNAPPPLSNILLIPSPHFICSAGAECCCRPLGLPALADLGLGGLKDLALGGLVPFLGGLNGLAGDLDYNSLYQQRSFLITPSNIDGTHPRTSSTSSERSRLSTHAISKTPQPPSPLQKKKLTVAPFLSASMRALALIIPAYAAEIALTPAFDTGDLPPPDEGATDPPRRAVCIVFFTTVFCLGDCALRNPAPVLAFPSFFVAAAAAFFFAGDFALALALDLAAGFFGAAAAGLAAAVFFAAAGFTAGLAADALAFGAAFTLPPAAGPARFLPVLAWFVAFALVAREAAALVLATSPLGYGSLRARTAAERRGRSAAGILMFLVRWWMANLRAVVDQRAVTVLSPV